MRTGYERLREGLAPARFARSGLAVRRSAGGGELARRYVSESDDAEIMDVAAASATDGRAIGRDRAHVSTATEKAGGYSTFFLPYDGRSWQGYDDAAELPQLAALGLKVLEASGPDNVWLFSTDLPPGALGTDPAFARWDGKRWREVPLPPAMTDKVKGAAVFAPDDVWLLAGEQRRPPPGRRLDSEQATWHWDGSRWTTPDRSGALDTSGRAGPTRRTSTTAWW
ncbi:hypothetical protein [Streptomyces sp. NPDC056983]|uniref:hypothetical protein n=1 Tax=Streptomyces sp. NPDC056983 TaxID=3345987 RepID=UPI003625D4F4